MWHNDKPANLVNLSFDEATNIKSNMIKSLFTEVSILYAATLAVKGKLDLAEEVINPISEGLIDVKALDLRAKILAQKKLYREALALWERALIVEPECRNLKDSWELCLLYCKLEDD